MSRPKASAGKMEKVAPGVYTRNGTFIVPIWNPSKGEKGGKDTHTLGRCACGRTHPGSTKSDALQLKRDLEQEKRDRAKLTSEMSVGEWAGHFDETGRWVKGKWLQTVPRRAESTNMQYDERMRSFSRRFADRPLTSITHEEAAEFAAEKPGALKEVRTMFMDAQKQKLVLVNPFENVRKVVSAGRSKITVLKDSELEQLYAITRAALGEYGRTYAAMIQTAAWTGMRPGELYVLSLAPGDQVNFVDLDGKKIYVEWQLQSRTMKITRPKNGTTREIPLLPKAEEALRSLHSPPAEGPVFLTKRGMPFNQRVQYYYWNTVRTAFVATLPPGHQLRQRMMEGGPGGDGNFDFYELRHFFGTKLAHPPAGVKPASPYEIAALMGHVDGGQLALARYVHVSADIAQQSVSDAWAKVS